MMKDAYQDNFPSLGEAPKENEAVAAAVSAVEDLKLSDEVNEEEEVEIDHEKILLECFQCAIRFKSKEFKLPLIVSTFMKIMQTCW